MKEYKNDIEKQMAAAQRKSELELAKLTAEQTEERQRLQEWVSKLDFVEIQVKVYEQFSNSQIAEARAEQEAMKLQYNTLAQQMKQQDEDNKRKQQEMMKIIEKKNYESHYPIPESLRQHLKKHPKSFNIQVRLSQCQFPRFWHITWTWSIGPCEILL